MEAQLETVDSVVVGGGPAGVVLSYLLARAGLKVVLLEAFKDFNRQFRGDTLNPLSMGLLAKLGLMDDILKLPHSKVADLKALNKVGLKAAQLTYSRLPTKFPYIMIISQPIFLDFMVAKAAAFPNFEVRMQARVNGLIEENGVIKGVQYRDANGRLHEVRATLTVGADGRNSIVRKEAGLESINLTEKADEVLWFKIPLADGDPVEGLVTLEDDLNALFMYRRPEEWQVSITVKKGTYKAMRERGIADFRRSVVNMVPEFAARMEAIDWEDTSLLKVELKRAKQWYREGLMLIGDAAHIMSPLGGIGINLAIRDAVMAANRLVEPLKRGSVTTRQLSALQQRVAWEIALTQKIQAAAQNSKDLTVPVPNAGKNANDVIGLPPAVQVLLKIPIVRDIPTFFLAFGLVPVRVSRALRQQPALAQPALPAELAPR
jgi:2-polyprenyl-6-methoxyphenol hydroxylase-like FAD-dependent oxidoreductase